MATPDLRRLAELVSERRKGLNLSLKRASELAPMSKDTWIRVEAGKEVQHQTYDKVEGVLRWTVGSCRKVLDGGEPILLADAGTHRILSVPPAELAAVVRGAFTDALIATNDELTSAEIRATTARALQFLRERGVLPPED